MATILLVEDDLLLGKGLKYDLEADGHKVDVVVLASTGLEFYHSGKYDLLLLDVNLPDGDGFALYKQLMQRRKTPVIFLTARDMEEDELMGFELGADDYVTKPFSMPLLRKRIEAVLRRTSGKNKERFNDGYLCVCFDNYQTKKDGKLIVLTPAEYKLLRCFVNNPGRVLTRTLLLERLWDVDAVFVDEHALTVNVGRLRAKIEDENHKYIQTIYGIGYKWQGEQYE